MRMGGWVACCCALAISGPGCGSVKNSDGDEDDGTDEDAADDDGNGDGGTNQRDGATQTDAAPDGAPADAMIVPATCEEVPLCGSAGQVASTADILAIADQCALWGTAPVDRDRRRTPTFEVETPISVCARDFDLPADCQEGSPPCEDPMLISVDARLDGVTGIDCDDARGAQFEVGARFRVRFNVIPAFNFPFRTAHLHFEPPCDATCVDGEHRCEDIDHCYPDENYCLDCGLGTPEECACRTAGGGALPNCTACTFVSGKVPVDGCCDSGVCDAFGDTCMFCAQ